MVMEGVIFGFPGKRSCQITCPYSAIRRFCHSTRRSQCQGRMGPFRHDDTADNAYNHLCLWHLPEEQIDGGRPVPDLIPGLRIDCRIGIDKSGAKKQQCPALLQMGYSLAGSHHPFPLECLAA